MLCCNKTTPLVIVFVIVDYEYYLLVKRVDNYQMFITCAAILNCVGSIRSKSTGTEAGALHRCLSECP